MSIGPKQPKSEWENIMQGHNVADATSVVLDINKKKEKVTKKRIKDIAKGLAEIAFSMGDTNDPETFAEEMTEDILLGLKKAQKNKDVKK